MRSDRSGRTLWPRSCSPPSNRSRSSGNGWMIEVRASGSSRALGALPTANPGFLCRLTAGRLLRHCLSSALPLFGRHPLCPGRPAVAQPLPAPCRPGRRPVRRPGRPGHALPAPCPSLPTPCPAPCRARRRLAGALADCCSAWLAPWPICGNPSPRPRRRPRRRRRRSRRAPRRPRRRPPRRVRSRPVAPGFGRASARPCRGSSARCRGALSAAPGPRPPRSPASPCRAAHARRRSAPAACEPWPGPLPAPSGRRLRPRPCRP